MGGGGVKQNAWEVGDSEWLMTCLMSCFMSWLIGTFNLTLIHINYY